MQPAPAVWNITTEAEVAAALRRNVKAEVYRCEDGTWNIATFGRFHDVALGLVEGMVASGKLTRKWPDCDACYVLAK